MLRFCHLKLARVFVGNQTNDNHLRSAFKVKVPTYVLAGPPQHMIRRGLVVPTKSWQNFIFPRSNWYKSISFNNHVFTKILDLPTALTLILCNTSFSLIWYLKNEHLLPTILSLLSYPVLVFTKFLAECLWPICRAGFVLVLYGRKTWCCFNFF
jgi:hypothetical protein